MEKTKENSSSLLNAAQVADHLNVSKPFVYKLIQTGKIRCVKINKSRRVRPQDLDEYIESNLSNSIRN